MYTYKRKNLPKHTIELAITVPNKDIKEEYSKASDELAKNLEVEGFRKGKAPKDVAERNLKKEDIYEKMVNTLVPKIYSEIVKKEDMKPIVSPRVELVKAQEDEDWEIKITTAETPRADLGNYKEKVKEAKKKTQDSDIWVPGKDQKKEQTEQDQEKQKQAIFQAALDAIMKEAKIEIPDMIIEQEVENRLSKFVDDVQKAGLTMDSYLRSKNTTKDKLKEQIQKEIEDTYKIEFILQEIADKENIKVEQEEIDKLFANVKDEKEKQAVEQNRYYYAALLRKQKTLDYLSSL